MADLAVYAGLFLLALIAATLLPAQSEAALVVLLLDGAYSTPLLLAVAVIGNTLGSLVNWFIGRSLERYRDRAWFPASPTQLARAQRWYQRYGQWSLLLSWLPVVGDPLTLIAGVMREPLLRFVVIVGVAKAGRYLALAGMT